MADTIEIFFVVMIGAVFLIMGLGFADTFYYDEYAVFEDTYLKSLQDGSTIRGSFSLGSGTIREKPQFVYYAIDGNGYVLRSVPADASKIIEDEDTKPYLRTYTFIRIGKITGQRVYDANNYEFHVPKETVIQQWNLDGQLR